MQKNCDCTPDLKTEETATKLKNVYEELANSQKTLNSLRDQIDSMIELQNKIKIDVSNIE